MTRPDLDALEKLADEATLPMSVKTIRMHKKAVREFRIFANPWKIKALIAELREAHSTVEELLYAQTDKSIAMGEAFLARNGGSQ